MAKNFDSMEDSNRSSNASIHDISDPSRRTVLRGSAAVAIGSLLAGCALPGAIGAKLAEPDVPVVAVVGDGGFMYTVQELMTAIELQLPIPVIIWNNDCLAMIRDGMDANDIPRMAIHPLAPDFPKLAQAFGCQSAAPNSKAELVECVKRALADKGPTLIVINEDSGWLTAE